MGIFKILNKNKKPESFREKFDIVDSEDADSEISYKLKIEELENEIKLRDEELSILKNTSDVINATYEIETVIAYLYMFFKKITGCDRYLILNQNPETGKLICKYEYGDNIQKVAGKEFESGNVIKESFQKNISIVKINTKLNDRDVTGDKLIIPLKSKNEMLGAVYFETVVPGTFKEINLRFVESLVTYVGIAIKNAELLDETHHKKIELKALYDTTINVNEDLNHYIEELTKTKEQLNNEHTKLSKLFEKMQNGFIQTVLAMANSIEAKDKYTGGHCQRVMEISCEIASKMGYNEDMITELRYAAILHDIGKIGIPAAIINKNGKLTDEEYDLIKKHPEISYDILKGVDFLQKGLEGILQHHERYDGRGYPNGIKGKEISEFGRILGIADAFDAMTSDRSYRPGMPLKSAIIEIRKCSGSQFDPDIVGIFETMFVSILESED
jgi:HD-GYP domain-containing protein (c-di-GMP phosphodiesterase class II)